MPKLVFGLSLAVAFLLGCVITQATAPTPPPAFAGAPGTIQKWDYYCVNKADVNAFKAAGEQGWELVAAAGAGGAVAHMVSSELVWCFKRPL